MNEIQYSCPNEKIRVKDIRYGYAGSQVHCFVTFEGFEARDPYYILMRTAQMIGMNIAATPQFKWAHEPWCRPEKISGSNSYIYDPTDYEYHGTAVLRVGDANDIEFAKAIAYRKAYRQFVGFYLACYTNLYDRVMAYAGDVWYNQIAQLSDRYLLCDNEIANKVEG